MLRDTYVCDYESLLVRFLCHFLNLGGHFCGSKVSKKSQCYCFGFLNDAKIGVKDDVSSSFLGIDCSRRLEDDDACDTN
jgi:hypothetical protein